METLKNSNEIPPFIIGICRDEWNMFFKIPFLPKPTDLETAQLDLADCMRAQPEFKDLDEYTLMQFSTYLLEKLDVIKSLDVGSCFSRAMTLVAFKASTWEILLACKNQQKSYAYVLNYEAHNGDGVPHLMDLGLLFGTFKDPLMHCWYPSGVDGNGSPPKRLSLTMQKYWGKFCHQGKFTSWPEFWPEDTALECLRVGNVQSNGNKIRVMHFGTGDDQQGHEVGLWDKQDIKLYLDLCNRAKKFK